MDNIPTYLGKWGHRMLAWEQENDAGEKEPALYLIAGDAVEGGSFVSDVFVSTETCEEVGAQLSSLLSSLRFFLSLTDQSRTADNDL